MNRRDFIAAASLTCAGLAMPLFAQSAGASRKFKLCLDGGPIGVSGDPRRQLEWAPQFGFEAITPSTQFIAGLSDTELHEFLGRMREKHIVWGAAGMPVQFRADEAAFKQGMRSLPEFAKTLQRAGVNRVATWLSPSHASLTYIANFKLHAARLREVSTVLADHAIRFGLEYVGPKTSWSGQRFPFIHTMAEMKDLIAEIHRDNVGFLLDSWHWHTAHETEADLLSLTAKDIVLCHLNDAPAGIPVDLQIDSKRDLPCATGVIDTKAYLGALVKVGYDGPVVCEPFKDDLRKMPAEQALATVAAAMKKAVALLGA